MPIHNNTTKTQSRKTQSHEVPLHEAQSNKTVIEWPTLGLFVLTYCGWLALTALYTHLPILMVLTVLTLLVTLHSSLQHEVIHGHPTPWPLLNNAMAFPALSLAVPFSRYELLHLQHHRNWLLTDPYDDSESYFVPLNNWRRFNALVQGVLNFNNTLLGRLMIGPAIMLARMIRNEYASCKTSTETRKSWGVHILSSVLVIAWLVVNGFSVPLYVMFVAYPAISLLMLRAYGEHLPEEKIELRSAIIKSNWLMRLLYLNNNFHRVHHDHPEVAWYQLPELHRREYSHHTEHVYTGYGELFRRYGFRQRFSVEHPFLGRD